MNWPRVWIGALLAGVVVNTGDFVIHGWILGPTWRELQHQGVVKMAAAYTLPLHVFVGFTLGFVLSWLYALVRPRLGPGPKTALLIGTIVWFVGWVPWSLGSLLWDNVYPHSVTVIPLIGGLFQCLAGVYLAGWQYMEKAP